MKASCPACGGSTACGDPTELRKDEQRILELANVAMEELIRMTQIREPLWLPSLDNSSFSVVLNEEEYLRKFPSDFALRTTAQKSEGSLAVAAVRMSPIKLAEILLDVDQWSTVFACIVARATMVEILSTGVGGTRNGAMQVMTAEFQVLSPAVRTRESPFVRYCKDYGGGILAVVDFSPDSLHPSALGRCRRRPSGCLIKEMSNGYSEVK
ncbi:hypothetical protein Vadar_026347 [Vaccinium darrowii]|uniref:Uncharacterized protein n=1 Tax=Vaccinium darrowii TaxID=229202 RepID=A0ACB7XCM6_9ERIC|nr:hypothetical protein Vadar_026347 [Vaccinium darrowii]